MTRPPHRIAFLNLNAGPHGDYGALLAAAVARQPQAEVLVIVPVGLMQGRRAAAHLAGVATAVVTPGEGLGRLAGLHAVWRLLRDFRPDLIHDPVGSGIPALLPLRPFLPLLAPVVVTEHNPVLHPGVAGWHHGPARAITRKTAGLIHVHGPQAFADMRGRGVPQDRLVQIRHGAFDEYGTAARGFDRGGSRQILVFGELRPNKGIDLLPEVFSRVRAVYPDATLLVAGAFPPNLDPQSGGLVAAALARLSETEGCTVLNARVPETDIPRLFGECGLCLLPYRSATQSGVAMIAMTTGAPLVATRAGDLPDIIDHDRTGLLANPDAPSIAAQVIRAFAQPAETRTRADRALRFAADECHWDVIGAQMVRAYARLLQSRPRPRREPGQRA